MVSGMGCLGLGLVKVRVRSKRALQGGSSERRAVVSGNEMYDHATLR